MEHQTRRSKKRWIPKPKPQYPKKPNPQTLLTKTCGISTLILFSATTVTKPSCLQKQVTEFSLSWEVHLELVSDPITIHDKVLLTECILELSTGMSIAKGEAKVD